MDFLMMLIVAALICAIILFEVNKRERAKITSFFAGNKIAQLIEADRKVQDILNMLYNQPSPYLSTDSRTYLSARLSQLTEDYENNDITLTQYHYGLDELLGNQYSSQQLNMSEGGAY